MPILYIQNTSYIVFSFFFSRTQHKYTYLHHPSSTIFTIFTNNCQNIKELQYSQIFVVNLYMGCSIN